MTGEVASGIAGGVGGHEPTLIPSLLELVFVFNHRRSMIEPSIWRQQASSTTKKSKNDYCNFCNSTQAQEVLQFSSG
jgi:hypothetical protein